MKRIISMVVMITMLLVCTINIYAHETVVDVYVNGEKTQADISCVKDGKSFVDVAELLSLLGIKMYLDVEDESIHIYFENDAPTSPSDTNGDFYCTICMRHDHQAHEHSHWQELYLTLPEPDLLYEY